MCLLFTKLIPFIEGKSMAKKARSRSKGSSTVCVDLYYVIRVKNG